MPLDVECLRTATRCLLRAAVAAAAAAATVVEVPPTAAAPPPMPDVAESLIQAEPGDDMTVVDAPLRSTGETASTGEMAANQQFGACELVTASVHAREHWLFPHTSSKLWRQLRDAMVLKLAPAVRQG